jgi:hypothetical protein
LKKALLLFAAAAVVIGCGGGGTDAGGTTGGTGGTGGSGGRGVPTVNLSGEAQIQVLFASGQGRRAPGSQIAVIQDVQLQNSVIDFVPTTQQGSQSPLRIMLDGYSLNARLFSENLNGLPEKRLTQFPLKVNQIEEDTGSGSNVVYSGPPVSFDPPFAARVTLFPGRQTTMQVNLNDAILSYDNNTGNVVLNRSQFQAENYDVADNRINGFISDYVAFDLTGLPAADRPSMQGGAPADYVHYSGEAIAISKGFDVPDSFEILNPVVIDQGVIRRPTVVGGDLTPGTYTVLEPDPRDPFNTNSRIVALKGIYRQYNEVLLDVPDFAMVVFPNSRGSQDNQVVCFNRSASGRITAFFQGVVRFTGSTAGSIQVWSVDQVDEGTANNIASGFIEFSKVNGVVRRGKFTFQRVPSGFAFPKEGEFVVFR